MSKTPRTVDDRRAESEAPSAKCRTALPPNTPALSRTKVSGAAFFARALRKSESFSEEIPLGDTRRKTDALPLGKRCL